MILDKDETMPSNRSLVWATAWGRLDPGK